MDERELADELDRIRYEVRKEGDDAAFDTLGGLVDGLRAELSEGENQTPSVQEETPEEEAPATPPNPLDGGFTAPYHWNGDVRAIDIYVPGGYGTPIALPIGGYVEAATSPAPGDTVWRAIHHGDDGLTRVFGHVIADQIRWGRVEANTPFAFVGASGLAILMQYEPAHIHYGVTASRDLDNDLMGDRPAINDWVLALGFHIEVVSQIPGPSDYMTGRWVAGRRVA